MDPFHLLSLGSKELPAYRTYIKEIHKIPCIHYNGDDAIKSKHFYWFSFGNPIQHIIYISIKNKH